MWGASHREREREGECQRNRERDREGERERERTSESEQHSNIYSRRQKQFIELFVSFFCVCCGFFSFIRGLWYHSPGTQHIIPYGIVHIHTDICTFVCMCLYICISSSKVLGCHVCSEVLGFVTPCLLCNVQLLS